MFTFPYAISFDLPKKLPIKNWKIAHCKIANWKLKIDPDAHFRSVSIQIWPLIIENWLIAHWTIENCPIIPYFWTTFTEAQNLEFKS